MNTTLNQSPPASVIDRKRAKKPPKTPQTPLPSKSAAGKVPTAILTLRRPSASATPLSFTEITGLIPDRLTKIIGLNADGSIRKEASAHLSKGEAQRIQVSGLAALRDHLDSLTTAQAVIWGTTNNELAKICTNADIMAKEAGAIARTREDFHFPQGPGVMMFDHDGLPNATLTADEFYARIITAAPVLAGAPMLGRPSASAGCHHADGRVLTALDRHRVYIPVADASLIPEAGKALEALMWTTPGDGWIQVGAAGQALLRCLVDTQVWQPERLDFAGPPVLEDGLIRPNVAGVIYGQDDGLFDLRLLIDSVTPAIRSAAEAAQRAARSATKAQCTAQAKKWASERAPALAARRGISLQKATAVLERASRFEVLMGDFDLMCSNGQRVTVSELLDDPQRWNDARFADPLDPDHDHRVAVARLLNGGRPDIYSHRHGGMRYELRRQSARVQIGRGLRIDSTDAVLRALRDGSELFDFGDKAIAYVAQGKAAPVTRDWLTDHMGRVADFFSVKTSLDEGGHPTSRTEIAEDAPTAISTAIMAKHGSRGFRRLTAVCTAPTLRLDGSIFDTPGHDAATGLFYVTRELNPLTVPQTPTIAEALDALAALWAPVSQFPLVDRVSIGVLFAAMLSAALRPSLPTCPAFGFDAPAAGTGKTLIAKCVAAIGTGTDIPVLPPAQEEDECRKRLFAALRGGEKALLWDNVREPLGNAVIDSFLTSPSFADRVLGVSETQELPNKALFLITGNNLVLTGDTHRRVLKVRLDAQAEQPFKREFAFDPQAQVIKDRQKLVVAALTIIRAYITAGSPRPAPGRTASFEHWDNLVRQPLCWLRQLVSASGRDDIPEFDDPIESITRAESENPEQTKLSALLCAWQGSFGSTPTTVATVLGQDRLRHVHLIDAVDEIAGQNGKVNNRMLGRWIERHAEQRSGGLRFVRAGRSHGVVLWQVLQTIERAATGGLGGSGGVSEPQ